jgi:hypothetical protein
MFPAASVSFTLSFTFAFSPIEHCEPVLELDFRIEESQSARDVEAIERLDELYQSIDVLLRRVRAHGRAAALADVARELRQSNGQRFSWLPGRRRPASLTRELAPPRRSAGRLCLCVAS